MVHQARMAQGWRGAGRQRAASGPARAGSGAWLGGAAGVLAVAVCVCGCVKDTRLSVEEFLALEQGRSLVPTTQPAATRPAEPPPTPWLEGPYRVGSDDILTVNISGLDAVGLPPAYTVRVSNEGKVTLPSIGAVLVGGMTLDEIEAEVQRLYSPKYIKNTQVTVQLTAAKVMPVVVLGDVPQPSTVELRRDRMSVLHAMMAAGGPAEFEGRVTVVPSSAPDRPVTYDLSRAHDLAEAAKLGSVGESDLLIVDRRPSDAVFVFGLVNIPGPQPLPRAATLSAMQAIGAAGGPILAFEPKEATLVRRRPDGQVIRVRLDLSRMMQGQDPDITLAAGDLLLVPHTSDTRFEEWVARNFVFRFGADTTFNPWGYYYFRKSDETQRATQGGNQGWLQTVGSQILSTGVFNPYTPPAP